MPKPDTRIETKEIRDYWFQFTGYVNGKIFLMSIPEEDDGQEFCEFVGLQYVEKHMPKA